MIEQEGKEALELNAPKEVELEEGEFEQVADEKKKSVKSWWILFSIYSAVWLLYPFIGPKGGPAPIHRMPYSEALAEYIWPLLILAAITYYYLIFRINTDIESGSKIVLKTNILKMAIDTKKDKVTIYTSINKARFFTIYRLRGEVDPDKPIVIHYLKRSKTVLHYSQHTDL